MGRGPPTVLSALASRDLAKARFAAEALGIPKAYGSYQELLADPDIEAIYNPLPNHMHVEWTTRALHAAKHLLCEKPIALGAGEAEGLIAVQRETGRLIGEAFVIRSHPQWQETRRLAQAGASGILSASRRCSRISTATRTRFATKRRPVAARSTTSVATQ
jgi:predicted dehydrogenase